ncbi:MAG: DUF2256 domain-containing protein [Cyanobacteriota bacterium]|jgi:hypothetical protein|nr:DUF2256 domain-containing protein [Cyanobacteriota bacterium]
MPHHADRPTKICVCCGRPFQWRRKWKAVWDDVRYCSDRCRRQVRGARRRQDSQGIQGTSDQSSPLPSVASAGTS